MAIENIELSLPGDTSTSAAREVTKATSTTAALSPVAGELRTALRKRDRLCLTRGTRASRHAQFDREMKSLIKRYVTRATAGIADRNGKAQARAMLYADTIALAHGLSMAAERYRARARSVTTCNVVVFTVGCVATSLALMI